MKRSSKKFRNAAKRSSKKMLATGMLVCLGTLPIWSNDDILLTIIPNAAKSLGSASGIDYDYGVGAKLTYRKGENLDLFVEGEYKNLALPNVSAISLMNGGVGAGYHFKFNDRCGLNVGAQIGAYMATKSGGTVTGLSGGLNVSFTYRINPVVSVEAGGNLNHYIASPDPLLTDIGGSAAVTLNLTEALTNKTKVKMETNELLPVFPVLYSWYKDNAFASVGITNEEDATIENVTVSFYQSQYMNQPNVCSYVPKLGKGETFDAELTAFFNERMLDLIDKTNTESTVIIEYTYLGQKKRKEISMVVPVYGRNSMSWDDDRRAAVFVSSKDPAALWFSKYISSIVRDNVRLGVAPNIQYAMGIFETLDQFGINYVIDPSSAYSDNVGSSSIDFLQFPYQTLTYRGGDCDDLSILTCSLFEAVGIKTAFITIPGHIFMAFDSGMTMEAAGQSMMNTENLIDYNGEAWVPLEITLSEEGFNKAWKVGAREWSVANANGTAAFYPMEECWKLYEPVSVPGASANFTLPDRTIVTRLFQHSMDQWIAREISPIVAQYNARLAMRDTVELRNELGILYGQYGLFVEADDQFKRARRLGYTPSLLNTANVYFARKQFKIALEWYKQVLEKEPDNELAILGVARCQYELEDYEQCDKAYDMVRNMNPALAAEYRYLGAFEQTVGRSYSLADRLALTKWDRGDSFSGIQNHGTEVELAENNQEDNSGFVVSDMIPSTVASYSDAEDILAKVQKITGGSSLLVPDAIVEDKKVYENIPPDPYASLDDYATLVQELPGLLAQIRLPEISFDDTKPVMVSDYQLIAKTSTPGSGLSENIEEYSSTHKNNPGSSAPVKRTALVLEKNKPSSSANVANVTKPADSNPAVAQATPVEMKTTSVPETTVAQQPPVETKTTYVPETTVAQQTPVETRTTYVPETTVVQQTPVETKTTYVPETTVAQTTPVETKTTYVPETTVTQQTPVETKTTYVPETTVTQQSTIETRNPFVPETTVAQAPVETKTTYVPETTVAQTTPVETKTTYAPETTVAQAPVETKTTYVPEMAVTQTTPVETKTTYVPETTVVQQIPVETRTTYVPETTVVQQTTVETKTTYVPETTVTQTTPVETKTTYVPETTVAQQRPVETRTTYIPETTVTQQTSVETKTTYVPEITVAQTTPVETKTTYVPAPTVAQTTPVETKTTYVPETTVVQQTPVETKTTYVPETTVAQQTPVETKTTYVPETTVETKTTYVPETTVAQTTPVETKTTYVPAPTVTQTTPVETKTTYVPAPTVAQTTPVETKTTYVPETTVTQQTPVETKTTYVPETTVAQQTPVETKTTYVPETTVVQQTPVETKTTYVPETTVTQTTPVETKTTYVPAPTVAQTTPVETKTTYVPETTVTQQTPVETKTTYVPAPTVAQTTPVEAKTTYVPETTVVQQTPVETKTTYVSAPTVAQTTPVETKTTYVPETTVVQQTSVETKTTYVPETTVTQQTPVETKATYVPETTVAQTTPVETKTTYVPETTVVQQTPVETKTTYVPAPTVAQQTPVETKTTYVPETTVAQQTPVETKTTYVPETTVVQQTPVETRTTYVTETTVAQPTPVETKTTYVPETTVVQQTPVETKTTYVPETTVAQQPPVETKTTYVPETTVTQQTPVETKTTYIPETTVVQQTPVETKTTYVPETTVAQQTPVETRTTYIPETTVVQQRPVETKTTYVPETTVTQQAPVKTDRDVWRNTSFADDSDVEISSYDDSLDDWGDDDFFASLMDDVSDDIFADTFEESSAEETKVSFNTSQESAVAMGPSLPTINEPVVERNVPRFSEQPSSEWVPEAVYTAKTIPGMKTRDEEMSMFATNKNWLYEEEPEVLSDDSAESIAYERYEEELEKIKQKELANKSSSSNSNDDMDVIFGYLNESVLDEIQYVSIVDKINQETERKLEIEEMRKKGIKQDTAKKKLIVPVNKVEQKIEPEKIIEVPETKETEVTVDISPVEENVNNMNDEQKSKVNIAPFIAGGSGLLGLLIIFILIFVKRDDDDDEENNPAQGTEAKE